jgi:hypothetical protein
LVCARCQREGVGGLPEQNPLGFVSCKAGTGLSL